MSNSRAYRCLLLGFFMLGSGMELCAAALPYSSANPSSYTAIDGNNYNFAWDMGDDGTLKKWIIFTADIPVVTNKTAAGELNIILANNDITYYYGLIIGGWSNSKSEFSNNGNTGGTVGAAEKYPSTYWISIETDGSMKWGRVDTTKVPASWDPSTVAAALKGTAASALGANANVKANPLRRVGLKCWSTSTVYYSNIVCGSVKADGTVVIAPSKAQVGFQPFQMAFLTDAQLTDLVSSTLLPSEAAALVPTLSTSQLTKLLSTTATPAQVGLILPNLTSAKITALKPQIQVLTPTQFAGVMTPLPDYVKAVLSPTQVISYNATQAGNLTPDRIKLLTFDQVIANLPYLTTKETIQAISTDDAILPSIPVTTLATLTTDQTKAFSQAQILALKVPQLATVLFPVGPTATK